jgi:hypothetical protein
VVLIHFFRQFWGTYRLLSREQFVLDSVFRLGSADENVLYLRRSLDNEAGVEVPDFCVRFASATIRIPRTSPMHQRRLLAIFRSSSQKNVARRSCLRPAPADAR